MRCVAAINICKFVHQWDTFVGVFSHERHCVKFPGIIICQCLPPSRKVEPWPEAEYRCKPATPDAFTPPLPPNLLKHLFSQPDCIRPNQTRILDQAPKKINGPLPGTGTEQQSFWGIDFEEGWNHEKITWIALFIFGLGSSLFAVLWSVFRWDVQGAFGVASWWVTLCTLLLTLLAQRERG
ncbi:hypothetical protein BDV96DRAFT_561211 [Lophiotrema nucula]|uniref:Uncharacterized protein n=1 Tax=Lophiotrema nucula TaxID=690887 RepID=A0A6A5ZWN6_9PLEO|nr:hypothetical protein BDV96DRAFT_561211 [Lophiotrema nucula]